jgi:hypothetical protein
MTNRYSPEVQEWYFLMNDPEYFERWRYTDNIDAYNNIIEEFEKCMSKHLQQRFARARIQNGMKKSKENW